MRVPTGLGGSVRRAVGLIATSVLVSLCLPASPASAAIGSDWQRLTNLNATKCLEVADWSRANGAPAREWDCHYGDNQLWYAGDIP
ncbi:RICIN domain-containing protein [Streptomyces sp. NPDC056891]|uniref:RICIN domain-containing protein n=1 Tax=Streptomyces sp. NPDC056891 TaxID=3345961 RepID=UPI00368058F6